MPFASSEIGATSECIAAAPDVGDVNSSDGASVIDEIMLPNFSLLGESDLSLVGTALVGIYCSITLGLSDVGSSLSSLSMLSLDTFLLMEDSEVVLAEAFGGFLGVR